MGYITTFSGDLQIAGAITPEQLQELESFTNMRHCRGDDSNERLAYAPSLWCDWRIVQCNDGSVVMYAVDGKNYHFKDWLDIIIKRFFKPWGLSANGLIQWQGEDPEDMGRLDVRSNHVRTLYAQITFTSNDD